MLRSKRNFSELKKTISKEEFLYAHKITMEFYKQDIRRKHKGKSSLLDKSLLKKIKEDMKYVYDHYE